MGMLNTILSLSLKEPTEPLCCTCAHVLYGVEYNLALLGAVPPADCIICAPRRPAAGGGQEIEAFGSSSESDDDQHTRVGRWDDPRETVSTYGEHSQGRNADVHMTTPDEDEDEDVFFDAPETPDPPVPSQTAHRPGGGATTTRRAPTRRLEEQASESDHKPSPLSTKLPRVRVRDDGSVASDCEPWSPVPAPDLGAAPERGRRPAGRDALPGSSVRRDVAEGR